MNSFKKKVIWKYKKKITVWKHIFEQVDDEIEVVISSLMNSQVDRVSSLTFPI